MERWPGRAAAQALRQWPTVAGLRDRVTGDPSMLGLVLQGSFAAGVADPVSDVDVMLVAQPGAFDDVWSRRAELTAGSLAWWEELLLDRPDCGVLVWLNRDLVLVEATLTTPGHARIAERAPSVVLAGPDDLLERFPRRPPVRRTEMRFTHPVELALKALQDAVRGPRPTVRPWEEPG